MAKKASIEIFGSKELLDKLEAAEKDIDQVLYKISVDSLQRAGQEIKDAYQAIPKKNPQNKTIKSYTEQFDMTDGVISGEVGFDLTKGGWGGLWYEVGTPYIQPHYYIEAVKNKLMQTLPDAQRQAIIQEIEGGK